MYNLLLINLFSYLTLHLFDSGIQGPELNWNFGLFFCRFSLLSMGRTLAFFHLTGDSPSCCDLSEEVESSLVMVLAGSFTPLRWMPGGCLEWSSVPLVPGDSSKKGIFCPQVSCSTKTVCPHLLSFAADLFIEAFVLVLHTLSVPGPEPVIVCEGAHVCVYILVF